MEWLTSNDGEPIDHAETNSTFRCPRCGAVSWHPMDVQEGYCGRCHDWTVDRAGQIGA